MDEFGRGLSRCKLQHSEIPLQQQRTRMYQPRVRGSVSMQVSARSSRHSSCTVSRRNRASTATKPSADAIFRRVRRQFQCSDEMQWHFHHERATPHSRANVFEHHVSGIQLASVKRRRLRLGMRALLVLKAHPSDKRIVADALYSVKRPHSCRPRPFALDHSRFGGKIRRPSQYDNANGERRRCSRANDGRYRPRTRRCWRRIP